MLRICLSPSSPSSTSSQHIRMDRGSVAGANISQCTDKAGAISRHDCAVQSFMTLSKTPEPLV